MKTPGSFVPSKPSGRLRTEPSGSRANRVSKRALTSSGLRAWRRSARALRSTAWLSSASTKTACSRWLYSTT
ncbi:hypothetical protein NR798_30365 [Archangium gephyra]|uniref:hypothetical protein n=1 Tax=Archangium gephyra TaxID=48 RepID=UPI0035D473FD